MREMSAPAYVGRRLLSTFIVASMAASPALHAQTKPALAAGTLVSASAPVTAMEICFSNPTAFPSEPNHKTEYLTAAFEVPVDALRAVPVLEPAFAEYLKATYQARLQVTCQPIWSIADARTVQKKIADDRDRAKLKMVDTGWRYGQPPLAPGQSGFDPLAQGASGLDLSQHRLTTYFCSLTADGGTTVAQTDTALANKAAYVSQVFQADWNSALVDRAYEQYIRDHYVHDLQLSNTPRCSAQSPAMQEMQHQRAMISSADNGHAVAVDFTYASAQAAGGNAAAVQAADTTSPSPSAALHEFYVFCLSDPTAPTIYFSEVFVGKADPTLQHGVSFRGIGNNFLAFLQQKYAFKSSANSVGRSSTSAQAPGSKQQLEDQYKKANKQIGETGWKSAS